MLLTRLIRGILGGGKRRGRRLRIGYVVVDVREDGIWVGDQFIPRKNILGIDTENRKIIYVDDEGRLHEVSYGGGRGKTIVLYSRRDEPQYYA